MEIDEFEKLVDKAVENLPENFKNAIDNVNVVVEEWPSGRFAQGRLLLGLYQGVPKTAWGRHQGLVVPDKISIYKGPIEFISRGDIEMIKKVIVDTVQHEIAHHFGIDDARLDELNR